MKDGSAGGRGSKLRLAGVLLRNETLKARKRPAFWVLAGIFAGGVALVSVASAMILAAEGVDVVRRGWTAVPPAAPTLGALCLGLAVALLFAAEFKWRTARQNVIDGLSTDGFFAGKLLLWALLAAAVLALAWTLGALAMLAVPPPGESHAPSLADLQAWAGFALAMGVWGGAAFFLAAVVRSGGPAVALLLGYFFTESIAAAVARALAVLRGWETGAAVIDYLPGQVADRLGDTLLHYGGTAPPEVAELLPVSPPGFWPLAAAACVYAGTFAVLAYLNFRSRDL